MPALYQPVRRGLTLLVSMPNSFKTGDFKAMVESAPEAIIVHDFRTFLYVNPLAASRLGSSQEALIGQSILDYIHEGSSQLVQARLRSLAETGRPGPPLMVQFVSRSGAVMSAEVISVPVNFDGKPAVLGLVRDVSQRLEAERALRESEERFSNAFRHSPHGMAFVALDGQWLRANTALCRMLGYTEAELRETDVEHVTHPDDVAEDFVQMGRLLRGEVGSYNRVKRCFRKDGQEIWVSVAVSAVHDAADKPMYFVGQIQDVTAQRELEQLALQAERRSVIAETTTALAHELNNALTALTMNAELLTDPMAPEEIREIAAEILAASHRIAATVQRLGDLSDPKSVVYLGNKRMLDLSAIASKDRA
jgi:two-component system, cell cycle sensor histidine kinase and response regulator CckA